MVARTPNSSSRPESSVEPPARTIRGAAVLQNLLTELALVLLPRGMTPKWFSELARAAFVQAAADISRLRNGRVNHSRVAALTGLTRADVKRLLQQKAFGSNKRGSSAMERVVEGWRTDPEFASHPGRSKQLLISGHRGSFAHLVKKYGGDVTHRAVLDELRRVGVVQDSINGSVFLRRSLHVGRRSNFSFLSSVMPVLVDALRLASRTNASTASSIRTLRIATETDVDLAIVRERCTSSAQAMLDGLAHTVGKRPTAHRKSQTRSINVTILLSENAANRGQRKRR
jgi:hypothetical protein